MRKLITILFLLISFASFGQYEKLFNGKNINPYNLILKDKFIWKGNEVYRDSLTYSQINGDSIRFRYLDGSWGNWYALNALMENAHEADPLFKDWNKTDGINIFSKQVMNWDEKLNPFALETDITGGVLDADFTSLAINGTDLSIIYEPAFSKNTAFNKNFGTTSGTVAEGNDSRILNGQTAYGWGNHSLAGYLTQVDTTASNIIDANWKTYIENHSGGLWADGDYGYKATTKNIEIANSFPKLYLNDTDEAGYFKIQNSGNSQVYFEYFISPVGYIPLILYRNSIAPLAIKDEVGNLGVNGQVLSSTGSGIKWINAGGGSGTVTSVGLSSSDFSVSGSPITTSGTITANLASSSVDAGNLNNNVISGQTALTSGLVSTDELMVSDAGLLKRMDVSVLQTYMQNNLSFGGSYTLPLAANGTRGGIQIGFTSTTNDFALQLSSEKAYTALPNSSTTVKGISRFDSNNFTVSTGLVSIKDLGISVPEINATGTPSSSTYLRGDGTWSVVSSSGGGDVYKVGTPVNNQVGIWTGNGTIEGDADLTFDGTNLSLTGEVTALNFNLGSDRRLKRNINLLDNTDWIENIEFYSFNFKSDTTKRNRFGVIAQEVEKYAPELVHTGEKGFKSVAYIDLLIAKTAQQDKRIEKLENTVEQLIKRLEALENEK